MKKYITLFLILFISQVASLNICQAAQEPVLPDIESITIAPCIKEQERLGLKSKICIEAISGAAGLCVGLVGFNISANSHKCEKCRISFVIDGKQIDEEYRESHLCYKAGAKTGSLSTIIGYVVYQSVKKGLTMLGEKYLNGTNVDANTQ